jgi:hypothetical protein
MTNTTTPATPDGLGAEITAYLSGGGLFNPELADHEAVRDLLIRCRTALTTPLADNGLAEALEAFVGALTDNGRNRPGQLSVDSDALRAIIARAKLALLRSPMPVTAEGVERGKAAAEKGLGLLDDGMCDDHGVFGCKRCLAALTTKADAAGEGVERAKQILTDYTKDADMRVTLALAALSRTPSQANDAAGQGEVERLREAIKDGLDGWIGISDIDEAAESVARSIHALNTSQGVK